MIVYSSFKLNCQWIKWPMLLVMSLNMIAECEHTYHEITFLFFIASKWWLILMSFSRASQLQCWQLLWQRWRQALTQSVALYVSHHSFFLPNRKLFKLVYSKCLRMSLLYIVQKTGQGTHRGRHPIWIWFLPLGICNGCDVFCYAVCWLESASNNAQVCSSKLLLPLLLLRET